MFFLNEFYTYRGQKHPGASVLGVLFFIFIHFLHYNYISIAPSSIAVHSIPVDFTLMFESITNRIGIQRRRSSFFI